MVKSFGLLVIIIFVVSIISKELPFVCFVNKKEVNKDNKEINQTSSNV